MHTMKFLFFFIILDKIDYTCLTQADKRINADKVKMVVVLVLLAAPGNTGVRTVANNPEI